MAGEGIFPKVDGDILFASEVNGFNDVNLETTDLIGQITPTETGTGSISNISNLSDGDHNTTSRLIVAGFGSSHIVKWDLGSIKSDLNILYNIAGTYNEGDPSTVSRNQSYIEVSDDDSIWDIVEFDESASQSSGEFFYTFQDVKTGYKFRYIRLRVLGATFVAGAGDTIQDIAQLKVVERI